MKMTSGVGLSDLACHRSMTLNFLSLSYGTLVMSGGVVEAGFVGGAWGAAFFALGFCSCAEIFSCATGRVVPRKAVISTTQSIRRYFISCLQPLPQGFARKFGFGGFFRITLSHSVSKRFRCCSKGTCH